MHLSRHLEPDTDLSVPGPRWMNENLAETVNVVMGQTVKHDHARLLLATHALRASSYLVAAA